LKKTHRHCEGFKEPCGLAKARGNLNRMHRIQATKKKRIVIAKAFAGLCAWLKLLQSHSRKLI